eukprot:TRINITY_DN10399_c0_g1_i1.p1 TRINITY_DN10399_c0_g1~~TRINITY_DN10399_c0_g1_i1.p1  ORF type:complete len:271 (-),score=49.98 TRINITY_DN10399_c0_g1_i1:34-846(-)
MGAGASTGISAATRAASEEDLRATLTGISEDARMKLVDVMSKMDKRPEPAEKDTTKKDEIKLSVTLINGITILDSVSLQVSDMVSSLEKQATEAHGAPISDLVSPAGAKLAAGATIEESGLHDGDVVTAVVKSMLTETFCARYYNPVGIDYNVRVTIRPDDGSFDRYLTGEMKIPSYYTHYPPEEHQKIKVHEGAAALADIQSMLLDEKPWIKYCVTFSEALDKNPEAAEKLHALLRSATEAKYFRLPWSCHAVVAGHRLELHMDEDDVS